MVTSVAPMTPTMAARIVEAMMDAKREGDAKKVAEAERRKAARASRKS